MTQSAGNDTFCLTFLHAASSVEGQEPEADEAGGAKAGAEGAAQQRGQDVESGRRGLVWRNVKHVKKKFERPTGASGEKEGGEAAAKGFAAAY